jgi:hypothetical protein
MVCWQVAVERMIPVKDVMYQQIRQLKTFIPHKDAGVLARIISSGGLRRFLGGLIGVALLTAFDGNAQVAPSRAKRAFTHERDVETAYVWSSIPRWERNMLVGYDHNHSTSPIIYTIDRDGRRDETLVAFSEAGLINLHDISSSASGEIAVVGSAYFTDSRGTCLIARISPDRKHQTITRTSPYCPLVVTFASDGTVWTIGPLGVRDLNVLQRFDSSGRVLDSTTLHVKGERTQGASYLRSSLDRVGWLTHDGEYVEWSLDGSEIGRYKAPQVSAQRDINGLALSDKNDVVVGRFGHGHAEFLALDRDIDDWNPLSVPKEYAPTWAYVHGFDGATLVTNSKNGTLRRFKPE